MTDPGTTLTIRDVARATGLSVKAVQRRIERGTLPARLEHGVRRIPVGALVDAQLVVQDDARATLRPTAASPAMLAELARRVEELEARLAALEGGEPDGDGHAETDGDGHADGIRANGRATADAA